MKHKTSDIWQYFVEAGENYVKCNICFKNYSNKGRSTTPLKGHLKAMHKEQYEEFCKLEEQKETVVKTPTVTPSTVMPSTDMLTTEAPSRRAGRHKSSDIWQCFEEVDENFAKCLICFNNYSRKGRTTSSLKGHLRSMHKEKYKELFEAEEQLVEISVDEIPPEYTVVSLTGKPKTSKIWQYFREIDEDTAECQICFKDYSKKGRSTNALKMHLKSMHKDKYEELCEMEESREIIEIDIPSASIPLPTRKKKQLWDTSHAVSKKMDDLIGEMIALQNLPFNFVEGMGFQRLMQMVMPNYQLRGRQFFSDHICEEIYPRMARKIGEMLKQFPKLSFTTDVWSKPLANVSFLGLTAHGITEDFTRMRVLLKCCSPYNRHTGDVICHNFRMMLLEWDIQEEQLHCFLRDGVSNTVKAMHLASKISEINCTVHGLQQCLRTALEKEELKNLIQKCIKITGHFKHSQIAQDELIQIQTEQLNQPALSVIQESPTRWNSIFYMLERLLEIKSSICLYSSNYNIPQFTSREWWCLSKLLAILKPFEEITRKFSEKQSCLSSVIPLIHALKHALQTEMEKSDTNLCFKDMIKKLLEDINVKFGDLSNNTLYSLATYLDPRYKSKFFSEVTKKQVQSELLRLLTLHDLSLESASVDDDDDDDGPSAPKVAKIESNPLDDGASTSTCKPTQGIESLKLEKILNYSSDDEDDEEENTAETKSKEKIWKSLINQYNRESILPLKEDPLMWWKYNTKYQAFAPIVRSYLSPPPASVPNEQFISEAGLNCESLTNNLEDDKTSELLFVKYNLPLLNFEY
ncbi:hypothetical protein PYW08_002553 [Mythimna loreyi]|uniref:Uncharacterized protein n=1 Tax=Mythimna loreyi TaxID=667449 RepID=A0ACC2QIB3_9NEOP|nr:hypothetical protein PYW08_002553 [Mythimna loreyi]